VAWLATTGELLGPLMTFLGEEARAAKAQKFAFKIDFEPSGSPGVKQIRPGHPDARKPAAASPAPRKPSPAASGDGFLTNPQAHLLKALSWWHQMGHEQPSRAQVAAIASWKVGGSNMRGRLAELSTAGLVYYPSSGAIALTEEGLAAAPVADTNTTLVDSIKAMLSNPQLLLFEALLETGSTPAAREDVAAKVGWEAGGSNMRGRLAELSALEVISYPGKGQVALQEWVVAS
jgi:hypothetical protein